MTAGTASEWWRPDPADPTAHPEWPPVDLEESGLSELILMRPDGSMRRILHPGTAILAWPQPAGEVAVTVAEGQCRYVMLPDPEPEWTVR